MKSISSYLDGNDDENESFLSYQNFKPFPFDSELSESENTQSNSYSLPKYFGLPDPWTPFWYFTVTGAEYCHSYFWIAKDLSWTQEWRITALAAGILSCLWALLIIFHAVRLLNWDEILNGLVLFMWIFANFWWMLGEVHDVTYPDSEPLSDTFTQDCANILTTALVMLGIYYLIVLPLHLLPINRVAIAEYDDGTLQPRFTYFRNFRQYENLHMMFWLAKDLAWNLENLSLWFVFLFPTVATAIDYIVIAYYAEDTTVDLVHYISTLLWVMGNMTWALGEFFDEDYDEPILLWKHSHEALITARWYSSWLLLSAFVPVVVLYLVWIPLTITGKYRIKS